MAPLEQDFHQKLCLVCLTASSNQIDNSGNSNQRNISRNILFFLGLAGLFSTSVFGQSGRVVAITIDDLPVVSRHFKDIESWQTVTSKIIKHLKAEQVPGIGFVNENKLYRDDIFDEQRSTCSSNGWITGWNWAITRFRTARCTTFRSKNIPQMCRKGETHSNR
ncbi:MAG: hypothetical protein R3C26_20010 [Calditrichia bacterium]